MTTGNAPVKVGVLVSLIGVGLLLREAHRRGIIELTIEMRLAAAAVFGLVLLAVGWRLRRRRPTYGLSLQGGGIAVLYVTLYAAFAAYEVLPPALAASAVVVVTAGAGVLSVVQDSRPLAVLGIVGGFLAPVLTYSQPEDHVYVFGFFAVLNAAIVGVAWFKTWPEFNLLGFVFTFGLTFFWLSNRYDQDGWIGTQPFIALFVLMYMSMPTLFVVREAPGLRRMWTGSSMFCSESGRGAWTGSSMLDSEFVRGAWTMPLVFGTPFIGLGLQQLAIGHIEYGLAVSAAVLAVAQGALAMVARRLGADRRELAEAGASLAVVFAAIAVPAGVGCLFHDDGVVAAGSGAGVVRMPPGPSPRDDQRGRAATAGCGILRHTSGGVVAVSAGRAGSGQRLLPWRVAAGSGRSGVGLAAAATRAPSGLRPGHRRNGAGLGDQLVDRGRADGDQLSAVVRAPGRRRSCSRWCLWAGPRWRRGG